MKAIAFSVVTLLCVGLLQAVSSSGQTANPSAKEPLRIDAVTGFIHLLNKPEIAAKHKAARYGCLLMHKAAPSGKRRTGDLQIGQAFRSAG